MLTKDLIRYRIRKGKLKPLFIDPDDPQLLDQAEAMIQVMLDGKGLHREILENDLAELIQASPVEAQISRGFEKLLMDRTDFENPSDEARPAFRDRIFTGVNQILNEISPDDEEAFAEAVSEKLGLPIETIRTQLYEDLPHLHPLISFKKIAPAALLHRYNTSLIQWLLLGAEKVTVTLENAKPARMRQLFKYLRFHQLLARVEREKKTTVLHITGPLSLFFQTRKYGMNLAMFFPALLHQAAWQLDARVSPRKGIEADLHLDQDCGIKPPPGRFLAYIPKEIQMLQDNLTRQLKAWTVEPGADFLRLPGEAACFPDFSLTHQNGSVAHIELFHPWHQSHLLERIAQMEQENATTLILGVEQRLTKDPAVKTALAQSNWFQDWGFNFREIPSARALGPILSRVVSDA